MKKLTVFVNDQSVFDYATETELSMEKLAFLDKMDSDMDRGIKIHGELIARPDSQQRAMFVAMNLIKALQQDKQAIISASCAYLANRQPGLIEIHANDNGDKLDINFVEEQLN
ncbi:MAG: hypothetical protein PVF28_00935 [Thioalkalispiraceae bacterium]|jgi:hypothetical protein